MTLVSINKVLISPICIKKKKIRRTGDRILIIPFKKKWNCDLKTKQMMKVAPEERWRSKRASALVRSALSSRFVLTAVSLFSIATLYLWIDGGVLARETADLQSGSLPPSDDATQRNTTQHSPALSPAAQPISEGKLLSSRADFLRKSYLREIFLSADETSGLRCLIIYFGFLFYISSLCLSSLLSSTAPPLDPLHHHLLHPPG